MPRKMMNELPPVRTGTQTIGERLSNIRKLRGFTQQELADKIGIKRSLVSDYEIGRLHLNDEMIIRFALALNISADEILGLKDITTTVDKVDLKIIKQIKDIEKLPSAQKKALLNTIDTYLKANSFTTSDSNDQS